MPGIITSLALSIGLLIPTAQAQNQKVEWCIVNENTGAVSWCYSTKRQCEANVTAYGTWVSCVPVSSN